jgi:peptidoglycan/xylan/chitin deacetylase (PgdA/CDA1 family)
LLETFQQRWMSRIGGRIPLAVLHLFTGVEIVVPYWHMVSDCALPHVSGLRRRFRNIRGFKEDVAFFLRHYVAITEDDLIRHLHSGQPLPARSVLFTFDDGFRECHDVIAPLLKNYGAPAIFFLTTASVDNRELCYIQKQSLLVEALKDNHSKAVLGKTSDELTAADIPTFSDLAYRILAITYRERRVLDDLAEILGCDFEAYLKSQRPYLSSEQITDLLRQGFAIGSHSTDHAVYAELSLNEQVSRTRESTRWLSDRFLTTCRTFAFPCHAHGVTAEFVRSVFAEGSIKICFDTGGCDPHRFPFTLSRFTPELSESPVSETLSRALCRRLVSGKRRVL